MAGLSADALAERFFVNVFWYQRTVSAPRLGGPYAWLVWSLAAIAFGYAFFHRVTPSVMVSDLMTEFAIGGAMLGTLSALYFYPYVLLQVPLGGMLGYLVPAGCYRWRCCWPVPGRSCLAPRTVLKSPIWAAF